MNVTKQHTVYQFRQSTRLGKSIKNNADQRVKTKTQFGNVVYKLMIHVFYGKFTEIKRKCENLDFLDDINTQNTKNQQSKRTFKEKKLENMRHSVYIQIMKKIFFFPNLFMNDFV